MTKLVDKYAELIDIGGLTDEEAEFVGRFSADMALAKVAGDEDLQGKFIAAFVLSLPENVATKVAKVMDEICQGGDMEKSAFDWRGMASAAGKGMLYGTAATAVPALLGVGAKALGKKIDQMRSDHGGAVLSSVFEKHPELKSNAEQVTANFATMQKFSPTLAKDPNAAGALLSNINQLGHGGMTYHVLSDLAKMESNVAKARHDTSGGFFEQMGGAIGHGGADIGKSIISGQIQKGLNI